MAICLSKRVFVAPDVLVQELEGDSVLLNLNSGRYFGLDHVGTRMWATLTTAASIQAASDTLQDEYEVEKDRLERDLQALVEKLVGHGLVEVRGG
jgi:hypothetical protein